MALGRGLRKDKWRDTLSLARRWSRRWAAGKLCYQAPGAKHSIEINNKKWIATVGQKWLWRTHYVPMALQWKSSVTRIGRKHAAGVTIGRRIPTCRFDDENALCSAFDRCDVCKISLPSTLQFTTISIKSATSTHETISTWWQNSGYSSPVFASMICIFRSSSVRMTTAS